MRVKLRISVHSLHCENNAIRLINHSEQKVLKVSSEIDILILNSNYFSK